MEALKTPHGLELFADLNHRFKYRNNLLGLSIQIYREDGLFWTHVGDSCWTKDFSACERHDTLEKALAWIDARVVQIYNILSATYGPKGS